MCTVEMERGAYTSGSCCDGPKTQSLSKSESVRKRGTDDVSGKSTRTGYAQALKDYLFVPRTCVSGRDVNIVAPISF